VDYSREAFAFIEGLEKLSSRDEVADAMQRAISGFGGESLFLTALPHADQRLEDVVFARRWSPEWFEIYTREQYIRVDPYACFLRSAGRPFEWHEVRYDPEREPKAAEVMRQRRDFGFRNGFIVPVLEPSGVSGFVSMTGARFELTPRTKPALHLMALYAYDRTRRLVAPCVSEKAQLTPREREVLTWAAQGKSAWEIGEILKIAKRTADEHTQSAFRKLGAVNKTQAVAIALRDGIIGL
jgi:LuxR family quorum sensing-dependent transcriptional regulator